VDNVFDKQAPLLFANNVLNANTDPSSFDTIGRYYFARLTVQFCFDRSKLHPFGPH
jgi:hypothetical protein